MVDWTEWIVFGIGVAMGGIAGWLARGLQYLHQEQRRVSNDLAREIGQIQQEREAEKMKEAGR